MTGPRGAEGMTLIEMLLAFTIGVLLVAVLLPMLAQGREQFRRLTCMGNLHELSRVFTLYSQESGGAFPPIAPNHQWGASSAEHPERQIRNNYILDVRGLYPGYITSFDIFVCHTARRSQDIPLSWWFRDVTFHPDHLEPAVANDPRNAAYVDTQPAVRADWECLTSQFYTYVPFAVTAETEALLMWDELDRRMALGEEGFASGALTVERDGLGEQRFSRLNADAALRDGVDPSRIPVLYDSISDNGRVRFNHHTPMGGNVLYLDGSTRFVRYDPDSAQIPYTRDLVEWTRSNVYNNEPLNNVPPWCANRTPGAPFEPRYRYYPEDSRYAGLYF